MCDISLTDLFETDDMNQIDLVKLICKIINTVLCNASVIKLKFFIILWHLI